MRVLAALRHRRAGDEPNGTSPPCVPVPAPVAGLRQERAQPRRVLPEDPQVPRRLQGRAALLVLLVRFPALRGCGGQEEGESQRCVPVCGILTVLIQALGRVNPQFCMYQRAEFSLS